MFNRKEARSCSRTRTRACSTCEEHVSQVSDAHTSGTHTCTYARGHARSKEPVNFFLAASPPFFSSLFTFRETSQRDGTAGT